MHILRQILERSSEKQKTGGRALTAEELCKITGYRQRNLKMITKKERQKKDMKAVISNSLRGCLCTGNKIETTVFNVT